MGKDPYPHQANGIPFCKDSWNDLCKHNCSGFTVLQSIGIDLKQAKSNNASPVELFNNMASLGIFFLNLSYEFIGKPIRKHKHFHLLKHAYDINSNFIHQDCPVILCGEALKLIWLTTQQSTNWHNAIHPDTRNTKTQQRLEQWRQWWTPNAIIDKFGLTCPSTPPSFAGLGPHSLRLC